MFNKFRFEVLIRNKSEVDQPRPLPPPRPGLPGSLPSAHNGEMLESAQTGLPPVQGLLPSVLKAEPSGQTGLAPPQDGVLPSEQGLGLPPGLPGLWARARVARPRRRRRDLIS